MPFPLSNRALWSRAGVAIAPSLHDTCKLLGRDGKDLGDLRVIPIRLKLCFVLMVGLVIRVVGRLAVIVGFIAIVLVQVEVVVRVVVILLGLIDLSDSVT